MREWINLKKVVVEELTLQKLLGGGRQKGQQRHILKK